MIAVDRSLKSDQKRPNLENTGNSVDF